AQRGPADSVVATLSALQKTDPQLAAVVIESLAIGWPRNAAPKLSDADVKTLQSLMTSLPAGLRDRLLALADRWERRDIFTANLAAVTADLKTALQNKTLDADKRTDAAKRLLGLDDSAGSVQLVL